MSKTDNYTFTGMHLQLFLRDFAKYFGLIVSEEACRRFIIDVLGEEHD